MNIRVCVYKHMHEFDIDGPQVVLIVDLQTTKSPFIENVTTNIFAFHGREHFVENTFSLQPLMLSSPSFSQRVDPACTHTRAHTPSLFLASLVKGL